MSTARHQSAVAAARSGLVIRDATPVGRSGENAPPRPGTRSAPAPHADTGGPDSFEPLPAPAKAMPAESVWRGAARFLSARARARAVHPSARLQ